MSGALFPLEFASEEFWLLTAVVIGFLFGFSLERAGFGNARKLAAQFYLHDMTVFKVMFTAILVAMVGLYTLAAVGVVDMQMLWINPTFVWAQLIGGFLLGVGFLMSGLCPGTSIVAAVSGRIDGFVTIAGIYVGTLLFAVTVDWFPGLERLYYAGSMDVSLLHEVLGVPATALILAIVVVAGLALIGAEAVERFFQQKRLPVELTPAPAPTAGRWKYALATSLAFVVLVTTAAGPAQTTPNPLEMRSIDALTLAEMVIVGNPNLLILDVRDHKPAGTPGIPTALAAATTEIPPALAVADAGATVVLVDNRGVLTEVPETWPREPRYWYLRGGFAAWQAEALTPLEPIGTSLEERDFCARQNQVAAFFSGAAVKPSSVGAPPAIPTGGPKKKKKKGSGC